ncbi:LamG-like jellyroll fold domain-containing protein [Acanthopleuribacter pedis]|uniref:LamG domain-containing protein n=1 Tax=Acanthopleuribacter pedis TaxID=442870 RepID=A0A8J7Q9G1_9BACT|nr:LamG-like jellyroll fold domain-containing protein [Acanthopleuribacter pedis]MBO1321091.1 LamG domain-containing protein [Acanthopleuribacter pedis]
MKCNTLFLRLVLAAMSVCLPPIASANPGVNPDPVPDPTLFSPSTITDARLLYIPFEDDTTDGLGFQPPGPVPSIKYGSTNDFEFTDCGGIKGNALKLYTGPFPAYSPGNLIEIEAGTISFWLKDDAWAVNDEDPEDVFLIDTDYRRFFQFGNNLAQGVIVLNKSAGLDPLTPVRITAQNTFNEDQIFFVDTLVQDWQIGQWNHVAMTWNGGLVSLYLNGTLAGRTQLPTDDLLPVLSDTLVFGNPWNPSIAGDTLMDEVYIFDRALSSDEIALLNATPDLTQLTADYTSDQLEVTQLYHHPSEDFVHLEGFLPFVPTDDNSGFSLELSFTDPTEETPVKCITYSAAQGNTFRVREPVTELVVDTTYDLRIDLVRGGTTVASQTFSIKKKPVPAWSGNNLGRTGEVPQPWTGVTFSNNPLNQASVWGRQYQFGDNLQPSQITALGTDLLAGSMTLLLDNQPATVTSSNWTQTSPKAATLTLDGTFPGNVQLTQSWEIAYDGLAYCRLTVSGNGNQSFDNLLLRIPIRREIAEVGYSLMEGRAPDMIGPIVDQLIHLDAAQKPSIWIGNQKVGLYWFAETVRDWPVSSNDGLVYLDARGVGGDVYLEITLANQNFDLSEPLELAFGIQATPVKPRDPLSRETLSPLHHNNSNWHINNYFNRLNPLESGWEDWFERHQDRPLMYMNLHYLWPGTQDLEGYAAEWISGASFTGGYRHDAPANTRISTTLASTSYQNYLLWQIKSLFDNHPRLAEAVGGLYLDTADSGFTLNREIGIAQPARDGFLSGEYSVFANREFRERLTLMLAEHYPHMVVKYHNTGFPEPPLAGFADFFLDGESIGDFKAQLETDFHYQNLPWFDHGPMTAMYIASQGGAPVFIPEISRLAAHGGLNAAQTNQKVFGDPGIGPAEHIVGMSLVHDIRLWDDHIHRMPLARAGQIMVRFGHDRFTEHLPWGADLPVTLADPNAETPLIWSVYRRPGKALLVIMNNEETAEEVCLNLDLAELGLSDGVDQALDLYRDISVSVSAWDPLAGPPEPGGDPVGEMVCSTWTGATHYVPLDPGSGPGQKSLMVEVPAHNFLALEVKEPNTFDTETVLNLGMEWSSVNESLDLSAYENHATASRIHPAIGKFTGGVQFHATSDMYVNKEAGDFADPSLFFGRDSYTVSSWIKTTQTRAPGIIGRGFPNHSEPDLAGWVLALDGDGQPTLRLKSGPTTVGLTVPEIANDGAWHQLTAVIDRQAGEVRLYLDGANEVTAPIPAAELTPRFDQSDQPLVIGDWPGQTEREFIGVLDDIRIIRKALSADQIANDFALAARWDFEGATLTDTSGHAVPTTVQGAVTPVAGVSGQAGAFDGATFAEIDSTHLQFASGSFSVSGFFKTSPNSDSRGIIRSGYHPENDTQNGWSLGVANNFLVFLARSGGIQTQLNHDQIVGNDDWHHAVAVVDRTSAEFRLYLNGERVDQQPIPAGTVDFDNAEPGAVGAAMFSNALTPFIGALDQIEVRKTALTDDDVQRLYGRVGRWRPGTEERVEDLSGYANHGLVRGHVPQPTNCTNGSVTQFEGATAVELEQSASLAFGEDAFRTNTTLAIQLGTGEPDQDLGVVGRGTPWSSTPGVRGWLVGISQFGLQPFFQVRDGNTTTTVFAGVSMARGTTYRVEAGLNRFTHQIWIELFSQDGVSLVRRVEDLAPGFGSVDTDTAVTLGRYGDFPDLDFIGEIQEVVIDRGPLALQTDK